MNKIFTLTACIFLIINQVSLAQTKKLKIKDQSFKNCWEVYYVLKSDKTTKSGNYKKYVNGKLCIDGYYNNGEKAGIWSVYNFDHQLVTRIDYNKGSVLHTAFDTYPSAAKTLEYPLYPQGDRPVIPLYGQDYSLYFLRQLINYPRYARENGISGKVVVGITIDKSGFISKYFIDTSASSSLDEEALRVIKMIPLEYLPAYKDGLPCESTITIPVKFTLAG